MTAIFVTATGTDIGKTFVTAGLIRHLRGAGRMVDALQLVAGSYLGTISHTLTALDTLKRRDLAVKTLVLNETPGSAVPIADAIVTLTSFAGGVPIIPLPRLQPGATHPAFAEIAARL